MSGHGWTHPFCERCWTETTMKTEVDEAGKSFIVEIRRPVQVIPEPGAEHEFCCRCGWPTWLGIFTRADSALLEFCPDNQGDVAE